MNKKLIILIVIGILAGLTGCKKDEPNNINLYQKDEELLKFVFDTSPYYEVIEDLIFYSGWDIEKVDEVIDKHRHLLTDSFVTMYREMADDTVTQGKDTEIEPPNIDIGDSGYQDFDESNPGYVEPPNIDTGDTQSGADQNGIDYDETTGLDQNDLDYAADEGIDLTQNDGLKYRSTINNFIAYALENEVDEFGAENSEVDSDYVDDEPVYSVNQIDAYKDKLIASVSYKYGGPMKVVVELVDNKINGYTIYR